MLRRKGPTTSKPQPLGTFLFEVDTTLPPDQMVKVSDMTALTKPITQVAQAASEVTSTVAVYDATTPVRAQVRGRH
ncbi:MAG: hypothetical protein ACXVEF_34500 [Polyangiales bacterium]